MKPILLTIAVLGLLGAMAFLKVSQLMGKEMIGEPNSKPPATQPGGVLNFTLKDIDGKDVDLNEYRGKVVMIVNVASKCGFTKQYTGLEALYEKYKDKGFVILAFPANNFKSQEPGTDAEIKEFCTSKYSVTFPMFSKISVDGDDKHPLYKYLTEAPAAGEFDGKISWNFNKFLVDRNGNVFARFGSKTTPEDAGLVGAVEKALAAKSQ